MYRQWCVALCNNKMTTCPPNASLSRVSTEYQAFAVFKAFAVVKLISEACESRRYVAKGPMVERGPENVVRIAFEIYYHAILSCQVDEVSISMIRV